MGGIISNPKYEAIVEHSGDCEYLGLTDSDVLKLHAVYTTLLIENTEGVSVDAVLSKFHFENIPVMRRAFMTMADEESEKIRDFRDFIFIIWHFCTHIERDMGLFLFDLYDVNRNMILELCEVETMVRDIYGDSYEEVTELQDLNDSFREFANGGVKRHYFKHFITINPALVSPCFTYRDSLRNDTLGNSRWEELMQRRLVLLRGAFKSAKEVQHLAALKQEHSPSTKSVAGDASTFEYPAAEICETSLDAPCISMDKEDDGLGEQFPFVLPTEDNCTNVLVN